jgi:hypothetical protein
MDELLSGADSVKIWVDTFIDRDGNHLQITWKTRDGRMFDWMLQEARNA